MPEIGHKRLAVRARRLWALTGEEALTGLQPDLYPVWVAAQFNPEDSFEGDEYLLGGSFVQPGVAGQFSFVGVRNKPQLAAQQLGYLVIVEAVAPAAQVAHLFFANTTAAILASQNMAVRETRLTTQGGLSYSSAAELIRGTDPTLGLNGSRLWPGSTLTPFALIPPGPVPYILAPGESLLCWATTAAQQIEVGFNVRERVAERYEGRRT